MAQTNVEFLTDVMQFARSGPLMQGFVMEALRVFSQEVLESDPPPEGDKAWEFISYPAWRACAQELHECIEARYVRS